MKTPGKKALETLVSLNKRTNYNPTALKDIYIRAHLYKKLNNYTLAIVDFKRVEKVLDKSLNDSKRKIPDSIKAKLIVNQTIVYDALANIYSMFEVQNTALHYYTKAVKSSPKDYRVLYNFTNYLTKIKSYRLSETYLKKILEKNPSHPHARWGISYLYLLLKNYDQALFHANLALVNEDKIIKGEAGNYDEGISIKAIRGLAYHKLGETEKGIKDLKEVLNRSKNNSYAMRNLGIIYLDQEKYQEACTLFQKAKSLDYVKIYDDTDFDDLAKNACDGIHSIIQKKIIELPYIYPNPIQNNLTIMNYEFKTFDYEFFNYQSISVLHGHSVDNRIDTSSLSSGFYILKIYNNPYSQTFKVIKE
ncbi:tetratricopeptide repeat protein [Flavobacterium sp. 7A]|uniref:tetratricopeptide repeat protein n=1 Tax=Flavobacterium sp. 7A TaxID=2940571 RepID=UPI002227B929|nr:tetratricopeptide repeat protein [Flavobacterium sp. 7A]MCW2121021.1 tetratricopeptide (TPR) repeat protein [Flavobacterium sp. 7A]